MPGQYIRGLEQLLTAGGDLAGIASVASFPVSRMDTAVDGEPAKLSNKELQGKSAIDNARMAVLPKQQQSDPRFLEPEFFHAGNEGGGVDV